MRRIAGTHDVEQADLELSRILHPSYGLPRRLRLVPDPDRAEPADEAGGQAAPDEGDNRHLAEVVRIDAIPAFLASRTVRRAPGP